MTSAPAHPCSSCGEVKPRVKRLESGGLCRRCYNHARREICSRCGQHRTPTTRTEAGEPLCGHCARRTHPCGRCGAIAQIQAITDGVRVCQRCYQRPARPCGRCGRLLPVAARYQNGDADVCHHCYRTPEQICGVCDQTGPVHTTNWPLGPVCTSCYRKTLRDPRNCGACGQVKALIGRSADGAAICGPCANVDLDYLCAQCGAAGEAHFARTCVRCSVTELATQLLAQATGAAPQALTGLPAALAERGRPESTLRWLLKPTPSALLRTIGAQDSVTHASIDACPPGHARHHLRDLLVDAGVLPARDEHTERLATWVEELTAQLPVEHARLIVPYARWSVLRTVRRRTRRKPTTVGVANSARSRVRAAAQFLRHIDTKDRTVDTVTQDALDAWTRGNRSRSTEIAPFVNWLNTVGLTDQLHVPTTSSAAPGEFNTEDVHRQLIRDLIAGSPPGTSLQVRVAGLLILLYGVQVERIHRLTTADLTTSDGRVYLSLVNKPVEVPLIVSKLIRQLADAAASTPSARTRVGDASYLFPSPRRAHEPVHPTTLGRLLARVSVHPRVARNTAMMALASEVPAAVIATQIGVTTPTATRWAQLSCRDNATFVLARVTGGTV